MVKVCGHSSWTRLSQMVPHQCSPALHRPISGAADFCLLPDTGGAFWVGRSALSSAIKRYEVFIQTRVVHDNSRKLTPQITIPTGYSENVSENYMLLWLLFLGCGTFWKQKRRMSRWRIAPTMRSLTCRRNKRSFRGIYDMVSGSWCIPKICLLYSMLMILMKLPVQSYVKCFRSWNPWFPQDADAMAGHENCHRGVLGRI